MTREDAVKFLIEKPYLLGHKLGFTKLTALSNEWIRAMLLSDDDYTLQAHRGSYKTTCVSIALAILMVLRPKQRIIFLRKTDADCKEVLTQVRNILLSPIMQGFVSIIYGQELRLTSDNVQALSTNMADGVKGTCQLISFGIGGSLTGKHADVIFTDDIVNLRDRISRAEREATINVVQELVNVKNRGGRFVNTGTPWHKDDAFKLMRNLVKYDCYQTGFMSDKEIAEVKASMIPSLFCANYELRHVADDQVLFKEPHYADINVDSIEMLRDGICHIDASYGGEDGTASTYAKKHADGHIYVLGKLFHAHVNNCIPKILADKQKFMLGRTICEDNGDKGYLKQLLRDMGDSHVQSYHEKTNKFIKITTELYRDWNNIIFLPETDAEYMAQILDYNENAEHDDAPDSAACVCRYLHKQLDNSDYNPIF